MNLSIYFVTPHNPDDGLVLAALRGGASVIQLRDKYASDSQMIAQAKRLAPMMADFDVPLIINDRLNVAIESDAAGLHIGQSDGDPIEMRMALGPQKALGLSVENLNQLEQVAKLQTGIIDYIGAGPIRATATKLDHAPPIGFEMLARIVKACSIPTVAIGGIGADDIPELKQTGCAGLAIVSAISSADDPETATRQLADKWSLE